MKQLSIRRKLSFIVGIAQCAIGGLGSVFAYVLYHNFFNIQAVLNMPSQDALLYLLILIAFGLLSTISGLFLMNEQ